MRIGLNIIGLSLGKWGGVETYFRNLLHYLQTIDTKNEYVLLCDLKNLAHFPLFNASFTARTYHFARPAIPWFVHRILRRTFDIDILKLVLKKMSLDVMHHPFTILNPRGLDAPSVLTFADMQHEFYPQFFTKIELRNRNRHYRPSTREATRIIVHAEYTRRCLVERYGICPEKIDVIYHGFGSEYRIIDDRDGLDNVRTKYSLTTPFLYYPAATWPHKNHIVLLNALAILRERYEFDGHLVLTGIAMNAHHGLLQHVERLGLSDCVKILGYLPYEELPFLYNLARIMVFPSLFEGFGIPLIEAMACGCPVVCSNTTSLPEVIGDAGILFDPNSPEEIAAKISEVWQSNELADKMRSRGLVRAKFFNWEETARRTIASYERASRL